MIEYYVMYLALRTWNPISTNPSIVPLKRINNKKTGKLLLFAMKTNMCNLMQSLQFFHVLLGVLCFLLQMFPNISSWVSWYFGGDNAPYPHPIGSMYGILYLPTFGWFLWWIGGKYIYIYIICIYIYYTWTLWVLVPTKKQLECHFSKTLPKCSWRSRYQKMTRFVGLAHPTTKLEERLVEEIQRSPVEVGSWKSQPSQVVVWNFFNQQ